jgi:fermentation-respiration switch protein FrsA (DUF1100 family)
MNELMYIFRPVFVLHGEEDQEVNVTHGKGLYSRIPDQFKYEPWFVPNRGHNDVCFGTYIATTYASIYILIICVFI